MPAYLHLCRCCLQAAASTPPHPEWTAVAGRAWRADRSLHRDCRQHYRRCSAARSVASGASLGSASLTRILQLNKSLVAADVDRAPGGRTTTCWRWNPSGTTHRSPSLKKQLIKEIHEKYRPLGFACTDGFVPFRIEMHSRSLAPVLVAWFAGHELWLRRAANGSLIVVDIHSEGGMPFVFPWGSSEHTSYRFPPAE